MAHSLNDIQTFQYLCDFYKLSAVPIFEGESYRGSITRNLEYNYQGAPRYFVNKDYAIYLAFQQIQNVIALLGELQEVTTLTFVCVNETQTWDYDDNDGMGVRHHVYPKTIVKKTYTTHTDTLDALFADLEKINNRHRYCNGISYSLEDSNAQRKYRLWQRIIPYARSFELFYGNGVVD